MDDRKIAAVLEKMIQCLSTENSDIPALQELETSILDGCSCRKYFCLLCKVRREARAVSDSRDRPIRDKLLVHWALLKLTLVPVRKQLAWAAIDTLRHGPSTDTRRRLTMVAFLIGWMNILGAGTDWWGAG